jgi:Protein of unknown function (DUF3126)
MPTMKKEEVQRLERYLRRTFKLDSLHVKLRPRKDDSADVSIGDEFIGVLFRDEEDDDSYQFQMAILDVDLEDA